MDEYKLPNNRVLKVEQDTFPLNPREDWDNLGNMICFHNNYTLGDYELSKEYKPEDYYKLKKRKDVVILPLYLYDHSGITMNTTGFSCPWDSGQVGFIYVTHETIRKEFGVKRVSKELREKVKGYLKGEVNVYDQYITGDVYSFFIYQKETCNLGCEHEEVEDSCGGFFGYDIKENGILDHISVDDVEAVLEQL
tara:strand:- start:5676 stop:6257 length:582 start_codon:yes stop_codon:yes gene_type:complete